MSWQGLHVLCGFVPIVAEHCLLLCFCWSSRIIAVLVCWLIIADHYCSRVLADHCGALASGGPEFPEVIAAFPLAARFLPSCVGRSSRCLCSRIGCLLFAWLVSFFFLFFFFFFFFLIIFRFDKQTALCQFLDSSQSFDVHRLSGTSRRPLCVFLLLWDHLGVLRCTHRK